MRGKERVGAGEMSVSGGVEKGESEKGTKGGI